MSERGKCSILLVDDMEENLVALEAVLSPLGQHLVSVRSGEQALKALLRQDFALVLLDVLMPGMDGFETAANIKRLDQTKNVPIIFLTGTDAGQDYAYRGYAVGAADFLTKPIDPWLLRTKVSVFLDLHLKNLQLAAQAEQLHHQLHQQRIAEERLSEIAERLACVEKLLRDKGDPPAAELADRIAGVERAVAELRGPADAPAGRESPRYGYHQVTGSSYTP